MRELQKAWAVVSSTASQQKNSNPKPCTRDLNDGGEKEEGFKISVMLHIVG